MTIKILATFMLLSTLAGCGKKIRSQTEPDTRASNAASTRLEQWSGRSDSIDSGWQAKSQP